jgi:hypothetical protein
MLSVTRVSDHSIAIVEVENRQAKALRMAGRGEYKARAVRHTKIANTLL